MNSRLRWLILMLMATEWLSGSIAGLASDWAVSSIDLKLPPALREYCHIVRFPQVWKLRHSDDEPEWVTQTGIEHHRSDYEFRVEGLLGTRFLVGAFTPHLGRRFDARNRYRVDLSDPSAPVLRASEDDWKAAAVVPLVRNSISSYRTRAPDRAILIGAQSAKSGARWPLKESATRLSPDAAWVVLQSMTEVKAPLFDTYQLFFDVYNAETGKKLFTLQGTYSGLGEVESCLEKTGWLTERYFIIPLGKHRERCVVCDFAPRRQPGGKP